MNTSSTNHSTINLFDENCWSDLLDYSNLLNDVASPADLPWVDPKLLPIDLGSSLDITLSGTGTRTGTASQISECAQRECQRKRGRNDPDSGIKTKACRERMRREKLNDRFTELSAILEPGRPVKTDKLAILVDAIRVLNELKTESTEYKEMNQKLLEEIKTLKAEKNELREEKLVLKADKERMEQQLKTIPIQPTGFMPTHQQPVYQAGSNKMAMFPSYGFVPMWHYLPPSNRDTTQDHELRPPAA